MLTQRLHLIQILITNWQGCSPRELGLDLESTRDRFFVVLVLVLRAVVLVLVLRLSVLVLKDWSRTFFETSYKLCSSVEVTS